MSADQIKVGDEVVVCGQLVDYNGTLEMNSGNKITYHKDNGGVEVGPDLPDDAVVFEVGNNIQTWNSVTDGTYGAGFETTTDDIEGEITRQVEAGPELFDRSFAEGALEKLLGESLQVPPSYSAISVDGVRSYKRARAGESFELAPRPIRVDAALLLSIDSADGFPVWTVAFQVSKGTYIRALARDLGRSVSSAAHLTSLMRTASGSVAIDSCISLDDLTSAAVSEGMLDPVALLHIPALDVSESDVEGILCGKRVAVAGVDIVEGTTLALVRAGKLLACAVVKDGYAYPRDVFPQPIEGVRS